MRPVAVATLCLLLLAPALIPRAAGETVLHTWAVGRYGDKSEATVTPADGYAFSVKNTGRNAVSASVFKSWSDVNYPLDMAAPTGADLVVGDYPLATDYAGPTNPMLHFVISAGIGSGEFQILELTYDANGEVLTLAADFAYHTDYTVSAYGYLRFNSSVPYAHPGGVAQFANNFYRVHETAGELKLNVARGDGSAGPLSVDYATADGTYLAGRDYAATAGTLTWADGDTADKAVTVPILNTHDPYLKDGTFTVRLSGPGAGPQAQANVTVVKDSSPVTFIHVEAHRNESGEIVPEATYSTASLDVITGQSDDYSGDCYFSVLDDFDSGFPAGSVSAQRSLSFGVGYLQPPLVVGDYQGAYEQMTDDHPLLGLSGFGSTNTFGSGSFQVREIVRAADGSLERFAADFSVAAAKYVPALRGQIRYHSTVPLPPASPTVNVPRLTVTATVPKVRGNGGVPGVFKLTREGDLSQPLTVYYRMQGTAQNGTDYKTLFGARDIKAGKSSATVKVKPYAPRFAAGKGKKTVELDVAPSGNYAADGADGVAMVKILPNR